MFDTIIIGSGPAGMSAAIYLRRANKKVLIIEKDAPGGQLIRTDVIENYLGFKTIGGAELAYQMYEHVSSLDVEFAFDEVINLKKTENFIVETTSNTYIAKSIIYATGNTNKGLNLPNERRLRGKGISFCAVCDGGLYKAQDVVVIGNSDHSLEETLYLANICKKVSFVTENSEEAFNKEILENIKNHSNIELLLNTKVTGFIGDTKLEKLQIDTEQKEIDCAAAFILLGLIPSSNSMEGIAIVDSNGFFIVDDLMQTKAPGIFAAGDCIKKTLRQVSTAVSDGAIAATSVIKYLQKVK